MKQSLDTRTKLLTKNPISLMIELSIPAAAVLEGQPVTVTVKDGTVTVTREAHPGADVLNREKAQELLLSPLASKGSKVPSEIWKNIPSDWFPLPLYCATADEF